MAGKKNYFKKVDTKRDFPEMEQEILDGWYESGLVDKYLRKNDGSKKYYSFLDGPITANNPMGVHHGWGRTYKDVWQRFKNMQGFRQRFQNGFDCQGLWVEVEVEKELGLEDKQDIENLIKGDTKKSIAKFVELCKKRVFKYADVQTEQSKRLGYFMDWENSYFTLSDDNNYMIWHFLKKCHEKGLVYKGRDSVPWCPRCGTAISQHEMLTEDYKEVTHDSIYIGYPIKGRKNEYLLVWTTTPWTLPGNVAVAVDPKKDYAAASGSVEGNTYYLLKSVAEKLNLKVKKTIKGKELVDLNYESPFDELERVRVAFEDYEHRVVEAKQRILEVSEDEGTGLVHVAPGAGSEDFALGKELDLPVVELIDEEANYLEGMGEFSGKNAKKNPELILDYVENAKGGEFFFDIEPYKHRYPSCWRCKTELVWRVVDEWYIAIDPVRQDMKKVAKKIDWIPEFGLKRELDWLENMHDWLISKSRYWGLALPIWECKKCGEFEVIGGKDELEKRAVEGWDKFEGQSPHRPYVDEVKIECKKCGGVASRIPDVGNPWLDAGIVAYSTISKDNKAANPKEEGGKPLYLADKNEWEKWFPADFITESFPGQFKNWFYALIAMSTVLEEREPFKTVLGFGTLLGEDGRPMHKSWGNAVEFNEGADKIGVDVMRWMYTRQNPADNLLFGYKVGDETRRRFHLKLWNVYNYFVTYANLDGWMPGKREEAKNVLDNWILSRLKETVDAVTDCLEGYDAFKATGKLEGFVNDLSNWYIRRSRGRTGVSVDASKDKEAFYQTTYSVLTTLAKLLAPFIPFMTEAMYKNLTKEESVHLADWPKVKLNVKKDLLEDMAKIREIAERAHAQRKKEGIPVRQPLALLKTSVAKLDEELESVLMEEVNVKKVRWGSGKKPADLDTKVTPELEEEAKTRNLIRKIQKERKKMGVSLKDSVVVTNEWLPEDETLLDDLKEVTLAEEVKRGSFKIEKAS